MLETFIYVMTLIVLNIFEKTKMYLYFLITEIRPSQEPTNVLPALPKPKSPMSWPCNEPRISCHGVELAIPEALHMRSDTRIGHHGNRRWRQIQIQI